MENREAIASLKTLCNTCTMYPKCVNDKPECFRAIEMAISALEKQTADKCCETCKYEDLELETYPCCDCIRAKDHYEPCTEEES